MIFQKKFGSRIFHTDTVKDDHDFETPYKVINTGVYLQDYAKYSGGLKIAPGSHKRRCLKVKTFTEGSLMIIKSIFKLNWEQILDVLNLHASVNIPSTPNDLILWNVRTHHSGYAVRLSLFPDVSLPPIIENFIPSFLKIPDNPNREVILSIFTAPSKYTEDYIQKQIEKDRRREHYINNGCLDLEEIRALATQTGITIRNDGYRHAKETS